MDNTFQTDITFISKVFNEATTQYDDTEITKTITLKELNRNDRSQHKLHFMIGSIFDVVPGKGGAPASVEVKSDALYDVSSRAIEILTVIDKDGKNGGITESEQTEILNDSLALLNFGEWFASKKALPFFLKSKEKLIK